MGRDYLNRYNKSGEKNEVSGENISLVVITNANSENPEKQILSPANIKDFPQDEEINDNAKLNWNADATMLFLALKNQSVKKIYR